MELSDRMIEAVAKNTRAVENGNILVCKPAFEEKTASGLYISQGHRDLKEKLAGIGRVVGLARNILPYDDGKMTGDIDVDVGDFILFVHEAVYKPPRDWLQKIYGFEWPENFLWTTTDKEVLLVFKKEELLK